MGMTKYECEDLPNLFGESLFCRSHNIYFLFQQSHRLVSWNFGNMISFRLVFAGDGVAFLAVESVGHVLCAAALEHAMICVPQGLWRYLAISKMTHQYAALAAFVRNTP